MKIYETITKFMGKRHNLKLGVCKQRIWLLGIMLISKAIAK